MNYLSRDENGNLKHLSKEQLMRRIPYGMLEDSRLFPGAMFKTDKGKKDFRITHFALTFTKPGAYDTRLLWDNRPVNNEGYIPSNLGALVKYAKIDGKLNGVPLSGSRINVAISFQGMRKDKLGLLTLLPAKEATYEGFMQRLAHEKGMRFFIPEEFVELPATDKKSLRADKSLIGKQFRNKRTAIHCTVMDVINADKIIMIWAGGFNQTISFTHLHAAYDYIPGVPPPKSVRDAETNILAVKHEGLEEWRKTLLPAYRSAAFRLRRDHLRNQERAAKEYLASLRRPTSASRALEL